MSPRHTPRPLGAPRSRAPAARHLLAGLRATLLACVFAGCGAASSSNGGGSPIDLGAWQKLERVLDLPMLAANPYDPSQADVWGELRTPTGDIVRVPAFVTRDYTRAIVDGREALTPASDLRWVVRFTPTEPGHFEWRFVAHQVTANGENDDHTSDWSSVEVGAPAVEEHGFLRVSERDPRYLRHDDGAPYFAIGENLCWYDGRGTFAYDDWLEKLASEGATYARLWMPSWAFALEWTERAPDGSVSASSLGDYTSRLDRAWQLDHVFEKARGLGIALLLSIQNHGAFSLTTNSEWDGNPYNAANGGPLDAPAQFFTDPTARALFERRLRYLVARYGYATNLLAWELWNEVDLADSPGAADLVDWHQSMARAIQDLDPARRPITTSLSGTPALLDLFLGTALFRDLWLLPEIAFTQVHLYSVVGLPLDFSHALPLLAEHMGRYGKATLAGEAGVDFRGPAETLAADPENVGVHDMLWSGALSGAFGTGMTWWWDNVVDPTDAYFHFGALATFVDGIAFDEEQFALGGATAVAPSTTVTALALRGRQNVLVWVKNDAHQWYRPDPSSITGATLHVLVEGSGAWHARWLDTYTGAEISRSTERTRGGAIDLPVPTFSRDLALRLER